VLDFGGVVLRYGQFHGPGTWSTTAGDIPGDGPKVGIDHAATATPAELASTARARQERAASLLPTFPPR
jgi:hypothetical protein